MGEPMRIQLSRRKGWKMPPNTVKVDRTTRFGNDFVMAHEGTRDIAIASFREKAEAQMEACPAFYSPLRGKNLACWCRLCPAHALGKTFGVECAACAACHSDILGEITNRAVCEAVTP